MSEIDFSKRMSVKRQFGGNNSQFKNEYDIIRYFESDRGRILNSAPVRRLQQKTQVFPLERNSAVRSRLTHSMEVQQVGRYIAKEILNKLDENDLLTTYHLSQYKVPFESLVEMACLMHDIGNPPFGHFGEAAINDWFRQHLAEGHSHQSKIKAYFDKIAVNQSLKQKIMTDLCHFEGNAQGIRLINTLQKLNLTYAQTACILKYTRPAYMTYEDVLNNKTLIDYNYLMKKPGYYLAEEAFITELWSTLEMAPYSRHPLTYIMEAADDISYCLADLEDAVEKSILNVESLYAALLSAWKKLHGPLTGKDLFSYTVDKAYKKATDKKYSYRSQNNIFFMNIRTNTVQAMVNYCTQRFIDNLPAIFQGNFNQPLIIEGSQNKIAETNLLAIYKRIAIEYVFKYEEVELREIQGYKILSGLLDNYHSLLCIPLNDFEELIEQDYHKKYLIETRLFHKLPPKHRHAYCEVMSEIKKKTSMTDDLPLWEFYYRCRLIVDYISGMTDHYAFDEYQKLNAIIL